MPQDLPGGEIDYDKPRFLVRRHERDGRASRGKSTWRARKRQAADDEFTTVHLSRYAYGKLSGP